MALTREMLKGMGLNEEQISAIISEHVAVTTSLKDQIKDLKDSATKLTDVQKELDDLKSKGGDWESKYQKEHEDFEKYKTSIAERDKIEGLKVAYRKLLIAQGIGEKYVDSILRITDFSSMELGDDGKFKDETKLAEGIKTDYESFMVSEETRGTNPETPPGDSGAMTKEAFQKMSLSERMNYANAHPTEASNFLK